MSVRPSVDSKPSTTAALFMEFCGSNLNRRIDPSKLFQKRVAGVDRSTPEEIIAGYRYSKASANLSAFYSD